MTSDMRGWGHGALAREDPGAWAGARTACDIRCSNRQRENDIYTHGGRDKVCKGEKNTIDVSS